MAKSAGRAMCQRARTGITKSQVSRSISTSRLHVLPRFHLTPIHVVVFDGPWGRACALREN
jgi:hypothetical protein